MKGSKEPNNNNKKSTSELLEIVTTKDPRPSSAPHVDSENIFAYNNKFSSMFKKKEENDDDFYHNLKNLNNEVLKSKLSMEYNNAETLSIKEENLFNKEFLNLINSPFVFRKKSNLSNYSESGVSDSQKMKHKFSTTSLTKVLKSGLQKGNNDIEYQDYQKQIFRKISSITNGGSEKPSPYIDNEKREVVGTRNTPNIKDFFGNVSNIALVKNINDSIPEANEFQENAKDFQTFSSNKNFIPKENFIINPFAKTNLNQNPIENKEKLQNEMAKANFNPSFNLFNYNYENSDSPPYISAFPQQNYIKPGQIQPINDFYNQKQNYNLYQSNVNNLNYNKKYEMNEYEYLKPQINPTIGYQGYQENYQYNQNYERQKLNQMNQNIYANVENFQGSKHKIVKQNINYDNMDNIDLLNYVNALAKDQSGCRMLQKRISNDMQFALQLYQKLRSNIVEYMYDSFGNYLIQKIIENLTIDKIKELIFIIESQFLNLGCSPHGTRVIQKIIEAIINDQETSQIFTRILNVNCLNLMKDVNGNHIIIKYVFCFPKSNDFIFDHLNKHIVELCTHKHGCCVLQKCIEGANDKQSFVLINNIIKNTKIFILDQFGNYVVQFVIMMNNHEVNKCFVQEIFKNDINFLSKQRFSSNVIEKCFDNSNKEIKEIIIKELAKPEIIYSLLFDMYGNYVLQKALSLSTEPHHSLFLKHISIHLEELRNFSSFGNKLYVKLINTYPKLNQSTKNPAQNSVPRKSNENQQKYKTENKKIRKSQY